MLQPKPNIDKLAPSPHGGINYIELEKLGISPETILDFSVSTNPFSYPPEVKEALSAVVIDRYPDSESTELREYLSVAKGVPVSGILVGSGSISTRTSQSSLKSLTDPNGTLFQSSRPSGRSTYMAVTSMPSRISERIAVSVKEGQLYKDTLVTPFLESFLRFLRRPFLTSSYSARYRFMKLYARTDF